MLTLSAMGIDMVQWHLKMETFVIPLRKILFIKPEVKLCLFYFLFCSIVIDRNHARK